MLEDGWEDRLKRSVYGVLAAGVDMFPILMSLNDLSGDRGNADKCLDVAVSALEVMGVPDGRNFIALTTDNPTTMQSFRRKFQNKFFWVLTFACFLHSLNTVVGEICAYPLIKAIVTKANRAVTFFNGSHYWGGQLKVEAKRLNISRGLKKNCESRWYALVLLCISVASHHQPLSITCLREDAQTKTKGLSAVSKDVIEIILQTPTFWPLLSQLIRVAKPIVDAIGNCESRRSTLADCMLELLRCARSMSKMELQDDDDSGFLDHAKATFDRRFIKIATPHHWLALFLNPSCRKLALSGDPEKGRGKSLEFMIKTALQIAQQWRWGPEKAKKLVEDLKAYNQFKSPFSGKASNAKEWWEAVPSSQHAAIKTLAIALASIVPHAADVERLFSDLGGIQSPHRNGWLVETMEKMGRIRSHLSYQLYQDKKAEGKATQRKHAHMHTRPDLGVDADLAADLENPITWIPPLSGANGGEEEADEDLVQKAYDDLQKQLADEAVADARSGAQTDLGPQGSIVGGEIVDFTELDRVDRGEVEAPADEIIDVVGNDTQGTWNIEDLM
ncbi:ribonuclease H-like domain-containing protein [Mycena polygramma]|nr:ribonuclease H-like domain-containing protein [Mycena polygramma]